MQNYLVHSHLTTLCILCKPIAQLPDLNLTLPLGTTYPFSPLVSYSVLQLSHGRRSYGHAVGLATGTQSTDDTVYFIQTNLFDSFHPLSHPHSKRIHSRITCVS